MEIDPISASYVRSAAAARERIQEYYENLALQRLAGAEYLGILGQAVKGFEAERRKNSDLFGIFHRDPPSLPR
jgi:hypothetical protein